MECPGCKTATMEEHCTSNTCTWFICKACKLVFDVIGRSMADRSLS